MTNKAQWRERALAAEVRRLRENETCADTECRDLHVRELQEEIAFEKTKRDRFVDEALEITVEQEAELKAALAENTALRERVAELEGTLEAARKGEQC